MNIENNVSGLKSNIENNVSELKSDMKEIKASHDKLANCVGTFNEHIKNVEKLTHSVPGLVQAVNSKLSENSNNLKKIGNRITHNRDSIIELKVRSSR